MIEVFKNYYKYPVSYSVSVEHKNKVSKNSIFLFFKVSLWIEIGSQNYLLGKGFEVHKLKFLPKS